MEFKKNKVLVSMRPLDPWSKDSSYFGKVVEQRKCRIEDCYELASRLGDDGWGYCDRHFYQLELSSQVEMAMENITKICCRAGCFKGRVSANAFCCAEHEHLCSQCERPAISRGMHGIPYCEEHWPRDAWPLEKPSQLITTQDQVDFLWQKLEAKLEAKLVEFLDMEKRWENLFRCHDRECTRLEYYLDTTWPGRKCGGPVHTAIELLEEYRRKL